jgi:hypothetical protein
MDHSQQRLARCEHWARAKAYRVGDFAQTGSSIVAGSKIAPNTFGMQEQAVSSSVSHHTPIAPIPNAIFTNMYSHCMLTVGKFGVRNVNIIAT